MTSKSVFEFGVDTLCYHRKIVEGMVLDRVLEEIAALQVGWVQINRYHLRGDESASRIAKLGQHARELGLRVIWSADTLGQAAWEQHKGLERIQTGIQQAVAVGAPILRMFSSWYRIEVLALGTLHAEFSYLRSLLEAVLPSLEKEGLTFGLENHSNLLGAELAQLIDQIASPHVRVHYDLVNPVAVFEDPIAVTRLLSPYAVSGHVKDLVANSVWGTESYYRMGFDVRYVFPGEGILSLGLALKAFRDGLSVPNIPLTLEGLNEPDDPTEKARRSLDYLQNLQREIGAQ